MNKTFFFLTSVCSAALCCLCLAPQSWAAEPSKEISQAERERIVRALVDGDEKKGALDKDPELDSPQWNPMLQQQAAPAQVLPVERSVPAVANPDAGKGLFEVNRKDAEAAVSVALAEAGAAELVDADIIKPINVVLYRYQRPLKVMVKGVTFDAEKKLWTGNILLVDDAQNVVTALPASGRWQEMIALPALKRTVRAGEVVTQDDVITLHYPKDRVHDDNVVDIAQLVGTTPRRSISAQRPIRTTEIQMPYVVQKGATVTMRYATSAMSITTVGEALQPGGLGEKIRVKNIDSNAIVQATIESPTQVRIGGPDGVNTGAAAVILPNEPKAAPPAAPVTQAAPEAALAPAAAPQQAPAAAPAAAPQPAAQAPDAAPTSTAYDPTKPADAQPLPQRAPEDEIDPTAHELYEKKQPTAPTPAPNTMTPEQKAALEKQQKQDKLVKDAFAEEEGMTPMKALEEMNPDDMIFVPKKIIDAGLPELDPTKPSQPHNPFAGMTP